MIPATQRVILDILIEMIRKKQLWNIIDTKNIQEPINIWYIQGVLFFVQGQKNPCDLIYLESV